MKNNKFVIVFSMLVLLIITICAISSCSKDDDNPTQPVYDEDDDSGNNNDDQVVTIALSPKLEMIDLGLPSGTLWANMNVGASSNADPGGYYSWGETIEVGKREYSFYHDDHTANPYYDNIGRNISGTSYDVATVIMGDSFCMPTIEQIMELSDNCEKSEYKLAGMDGYVFTGKNGNKIFIPKGGMKDHWGSTWNSSTGYHWVLNSTDYGKSVSLWSSTFCYDWATDDCAYMYGLPKWFKVATSRSNGLNVRAVNSK